MKNKLKKKFLWLESWYIEEQEAWFSNMTLEGWKLINIGHFFATFEKSEPEKVNYRCDIFKVNDQYYNRIDFYQQAGWEHIGSRGFVQIFRGSDDVTSEIHTDASELAETVSLLKRDITKRCWMVLFLSIIIIILQMSTLFIDPVDNYVEDNFIDAAVMILIYVSVCFNMITGMFHLSKLMKKMKAGHLFDRKLDYKKKMNRSKMIGSGTIALATIWMIYIVSNTIMYITQERFPEIPNKELPIVHMSNVFDNFEYVTRNGEIDRRANFYTEQSSILVPNYYELEEQVIVPNTMWDDKSGVYRHSLKSYGYEIRSEWLAKTFTQSLKDKYTNDYDGFYEQQFHSEFDELWLRKTDTKSDFIARKGRFVYRVVYRGMESTEDIIDLSFAKVPN
ncbi:DUF2812 domain-containing protein [Bacillus sp. SCS-151]|uniref:DUF2812 domain-containing protein n=1 Tax=Nanhaiella sioensis TaxID=3115293 RepID=UPI00397C1372